MEAGNVSSERTSRLSRDSARSEGYDNHGMLESELDVGGINFQMQSRDERAVVINTDNVVDGTATEGIASYDPYAHRNIRHPTSYFETWIHLMKASLGTGILAMPNAFKNSGYVTGTIGTVLIGLLCVYCIHLLVSAAYELCVRRRVPSISYPDAAAAAFEGGPEAVRKYAPHVKITTMVFLALYQIGSSCVYLIFMATNIKSVVDEQFGINLNIRVYMMYLLVPLVAISLVRNLKLLAPFSSVATFLTNVSLLIIFYYVLREPLTFDDRKPVGDFQGMSSFFGTVLFAMEAIGVILPLKNEMSMPKTFSELFGVLNTAIFPITMLYSLVGFLGYLKYGEKTMGTITQNMPQHEILSKTVLVCLSLSIYVNYALSNFVTFDIIWGVVDRRLEKFRYRTYVEIALRVAIVFVTYFLAITIPNLEILISLIGASCLSMVGIALPAVVHFLTYADHYRAKGRVPYAVHCSRTVAIIAVAVFAFVVGVSTSVSDLVDLVRSATE